MYICVEKAKEVFNVNGESLGKGSDSALYYLKDLGRRRIYRQTYPTPQYKGLKLFTYKRKENAQKLCDYTNSIFNSKYEVFEIKEKE